MEDPAPGLHPLAGGFSGETFLSSAFGEEAVVRIYAGRSRVRRSAAPEIDAAVLELVRGLLPVPRVLEVRPGGPGGEPPGLLVCARLPGERLDLLLPGLDPSGLEHLGRQVGILAARLGHMVQPRAGFFLDRSLTVGELPPEARDLPAWVEHHEERLGLSDGQRARLYDVAESAQALLDEAPVRRTVLVHGDLNPKNLLVDPEGLRITGLVDWEFSHAGSPYADLGNLLRHAVDPAWETAVLAGYAATMPAPVDPCLAQRARAMDLFALVEMATRPADEPGAHLERRLLRERLGAGS